MTIIPYLLILGLLGLLTARFCWLAYMTHCWEQMVAIYVVHAKRPIGDIALLAPTIPAWQMLLNVWCWHYPDFVINRQGYSDMVTFFDCRVTESS